MVFNALEEYHDSWQKILDLTLLLIFALELHEAEMCHGVQDTTRSSFALAYMHHNRSPRTISFGTSVLEKK